MKKLTVVIPCYNHGAYLPETIQSLEKADQSLFDVIIIDDGSKDPLTLNVFEELKAKGYNIIHQKNQGLGRTRNNLFNLAQTPYVLPLDSDNKIRPEFINIAIEVLDSNPNVSVVYSDAEYFGEAKGIKQVGEFNLQKLMLYNYIDACTVIRKSTWEKVGGYDANMPFAGIEDWDLWLRISFNGFQFQYIPKVLYDYRVRSNSMARTETANNLLKLRVYLEEKYKGKIGFTIIEDYIQNRFKQKPILFIVKLILRSWFRKTYTRLQDSGKIQDN